MEETKQSTGYPRKQLPKIVVLIPDFIVLDYCLKYLAYFSNSEEESKVSVPIQEFKSDSYFSELSNENSG